MYYEETLLKIKENEEKEVKQAYRYKKERLDAMNEAADKAAIWEKLSSRNRVDHTFLEYKQKITDAFVTEVSLEVCLILCLKWHMQLILQWNLF